MGSTAGIFARATGTSWVGDTECRSTRRPRRQTKIRNAIQRSWRRWPMFWGFLSCSCRRRSRRPRGIPERVLGLGAGGCIGLPVASGRAPAELAPGLLVYGPDKGNYKDRRDQHQPPGRDEPQRDEEDGTRARRKAPHLGRPHEGKERGEEGQEDENHPSGEVPDLDGRLLDRVGRAPLCGVPRLPHALQRPPELRLPCEPDNPREVVGLTRGLVHPQERQVVAPVQLDGSRVGRGELLEEGVGVEAGGEAASLLLGAAGRAAALASRGPARYLGDLEEEHLAGELDGALTLAPPRGYLRPDAARAVLLAPQAVDLLLVEIPLGEGVGRVPQPVGLLERLRDLSLFHRSVLTPRSRSHAPYPRTVNDTTRTMRHTPYRPSRRPASSPSSRSHNE